MGLWQIGNGGVVHGEDGCEIWEKEINAKMVTKVKVEGLLRRNWEN